MIIESSFFKTLEALLANADGENLRERSFVNIFSNCILQELNSKNVDNPLHLIQLEKPFDHYASTATHRKRCDLYVDFEEFILKDELKPYKIYSKNWLEFKYFGNAERVTGNPTTVKNVGKIINDLIRLGWNQYKSADKDQGYYFSVGFRHEKFAYLARTSTRKNNDRQWLSTIFLPGIHDITINLQNETKEAKKAVEFDNISTFNLRVKTTNYEPIDSVSNDNLFSAYLIQILNFDPTLV
ncbi:hypothetical protein [Enterococcus sp. AZ109]|uniref:hypothetical protein n=1 Tax=Enterococcus sp. AZ109 TaxID=2774634 RepID=UPI003F22206F